MIKIPVVHRLRPKGLLESHDPLEPLLYQDWIRVVLKLRRTLLYELLRDHAGTTAFRAMTTFYATTRAYYYMALITSYNTSTSLLSLALGGPVDDSITWDFLLNISDSLLERKHLLSI